MKEVIKERTMTSKTFDLGGGKFETRVMSYPVHYKTEDGTWEEVNLDIKERKSWEFSHALTENVYRAYFQDLTSENTHLVGIEFVNEDGDELWLNYKLKGASPTEAKKGQETFVFKNCFEGVDVEYVANPDKLKENIILNGKTDIREFTYTLKMGGVSVEQEGEEIYIVEEKTGKTVWEIEKPYMVDAAGEISYGVRYEVSQGEDFRELRVIVTDEDFLDRAEYPVVIDPTSTLDYEGAIEMDAYVATSTPYVTGNLNITASGSGSSGSINSPRNRAFIKFKDMSNIVPVSARLSLYCSSREYNARDVIVRRLVNPWTYTSMHASWADAGDLVASKPTNLNVTGTFWEFDITRYFASEAYRQGDHGIALTLHFSGGVGGTPSVTFSSTRNSDVSRRPFLVLTYLKTPTLGFHEGNPDETGYFTDNAGNVFKYLDFGTLVAGQTSLPKKVYLRNLSDFNVREVSIRVSRSEMPEGVRIQISKYNNPFIPEEYLVFDGVLSPDEDLVFYVRIATTEEAKVGWNFPIRAKAIPHES